MLSFFKANPSVTGTACSFWLNSKDGSFWCSLLKQSAWDSNKKRGSFAANRDTNKHARVKFNVTEICGFIEVIENNIQLKDAGVSGYHSSQKQVVKFSFSPITSKDGRNGFALSVTKEEKEDSTNQVQFKIGFSKAEARSLLIFFDEMARRSFKTFGESDGQEEEESPAPSKPKQNVKPSEDKESESFDF
tara:strand:- start:671 stop:1240 length:570 start_codon:yes stop_codon:yes gene_type:complete